MGAGQDRSTVVEVHMRNMIYSVPLSLSLSLSLSLCVCVCVCLYVREWV